MGDDQAGLAVADRLLERHLPSTVVVRTETPGSELAAEPGGEVRLLIIVDAAPADENHPAGSFELLNYRKRPGAFSERAQYGGTHGLGVCSGLKLAEALGQLPKDDVWVYAVFGSSFERRLELSAPVAAVIEAVVDRIECDVQRWLCDHLGADPS